MHDRYEEAAREILIAIAKKELEECADLVSACAEILNVELLMGEIINNEYPATLGLDMDTRVTIANCLEDEACDLVSEWLASAD